jgi:DNA-binding NtrC family response regulator
MAKILIVEDDGAVRQALARSLSSADYSVEQASGVAEAAEKIRQSAGRFDVIVTDMRMEEEHSGIAVVEQARELSPDTPVIVLTGYAEIDDSVQSMRAGAFSYLTKRGDEGDSELLAIHIHRAILLRAALTSDPLFKALERVLREFPPIQSKLRTVAAQLKSVADARHRFFGVLARGDGDLPPAEDGKE